MAGNDITLILGDASALDKMPKEWQQFFRDAGVKRKDLADPDTANFIAQTLTTAMEENPPDDAAPAATPEAALASAAPSPAPAASPPVAPSAPSSVPSGLPGPASDPPQVIT